MLQYWDDLITSESWFVLQKINRTYRFTLIGGWAVYVYTRALKSRDIDIIVDFKTLARLKDDFTVNKNERLKKYEIKETKFDIDIYVPHYSNPGLPAEMVIAETIEKDGFHVPKIEILLIIKQAVFKKRRGSIKGEKDKLDIFSLLCDGIDVRLYKNLLSKYGVPHLRDELVVLLNTALALPEIGLTSYTLARLRKRVLADLEI